MPTQERAAPRDLGALRDLLLTPHWHEFPSLI
jgi:hypothetical protein